MTQTSLESSLSPLLDDDISHTVSEDRLQEAAKIKEEQKTLQGRLEKLDQSHSQVSDVVYQKVRSDYVTKVKEAEGRLNSLKKDLEAERKALTQKKTKVQAQMGHHQEKIEEVGLRHSLGEYSAKDHQKVVEEQKREMERLQTSLHSLDAGLERYQNLFGDLSSPPPRDKGPERESKKEPMKKPERAESEPPSQDTARIRVAAIETDKVAPPLSPVPSDKTPELLVLENGKVIQMVPLDKTIQIGRSPSNDIVLKEPKVSRKHAEVHAAGGKYIILDLESSNGTYVGGQKITEQILQPNDEIMIGNTKMVFKI